MINSGLLREIVTSGLVSGTVIKLTGGSVTNTIAAAVIAGTNAGVYFAQKQSGAIVNSGSLLAYGGGGYSVTRFGAAQGNGHEQRDSGDGSGWHLRYFRREAKGRPRRHQ